MFYGFEHGTGLGMEGSFKDPNAFKTCEAFLNAGVSPRKAINRNLLLGPPPQNAHSTTDAL